MSGKNGPESGLTRSSTTAFSTRATAGHDLQDRRPESQQGQFVWVTDPGEARGNVPRSRGIALWEELVIASRPDGRVIAVNRPGEIVWDKMVAATNEFGAGSGSAAPIAADGRSSWPTGPTRTRVDRRARARSGKELWRW
jgi:alcohol dehydrogenase (cytochrome c)